MPQHFNLTAAKAAKRIKNRELSPVELVESLLGQYDALEPGLSAWVYLDREAVLADAQQKQEELEKGGSIGPLHGVPIGLKDIYYTAGIPTTA